MTGEAFKTPHDTVFVKFNPFNVITMLKVLLVSGSTFVVNPATMEIAMSQKVATELFGLEQDADDH